MFCHCFQWQVWQWKKHNSLTSIISQLTVLELFDLVISLLQVKELFFCPQYQQIPFFALRHATDSHDFRPCFVPSWCTNNLLLLLYRQPTAHTMYHSLDGRGYMASNTGHAELHFFKILFTKVDIPFTKWCVVTAAVSMFDHEDCSKVTG